MAALHVLVAESDIRAPVSNVLSCADATPSAGGAVEAVVSNKLISSLYDSCAYRGRYVRLDDSDLHYWNSDLLDECRHPLIDQLSDCLEWRVTSQHDFAETSHVNIQEVEEIRALLNRLVSQTLYPLRSVNLTDSLVALHSWAKGRSSAFHLNFQLMLACGPACLGKNCLHNLHVRTDKCRGDYPSRKLPLPDPGTTPKSVKPLVVPETWVPSASSSSSLNRAD